MHPWQLLLAFYGVLINRQSALIIDYLTTENRILRSQLPQRRLILNDSQRRRLAEKAKLVGRKGLFEIQTLFTPDTLLRWHRKLCAQQHTYVSKLVQLGRPVLLQETIEAVLRIARENPAWGYQRICGACNNLGLKLSASAVRDILQDHGIEPARKRGKSPSWSEFIAAHLDVLAAIDFTTIDIWSGGKLKTLYLLFFLNLGSRRVHFAGMTEHPNEAWMMQVARDMQQNQFLKEKKLLLMDRDSKFTASFCKALEDAGTQPLKIPPRSPNCNAYIERFFGSLKRECLQSMIFFGETMLRNAIEKYLDYYHAHRNHQGLNNLRITPPPESEPPDGEIVCQRELGGILKHYHRQAA